MRVTVRLFAILRDKAGTSEAAIDLPPGSTVAAAVAALERSHPVLSPLLNRVAFAVNREYAGRDVTLADGDEVAIIPPVSGGAA